MSAFDYFTIDSEIFGWKISANRNGFIFNEKIEVFLAQSRMHFLRELGIFKLELPL